MYWKGTKKVNANHKMTVTVMAEELRNAINQSFTKLEIIMCYQEVEKSDVNRLGEISSQIREFTSTTNSDEETAQRQSAKRYL